MPTYYSLLAFPILIIMNDNTDQWTQLTKANKSNDSIQQLISFLLSIIQ